MADTGLQNNNIVIAGGFRGIGFELAKLLLMEGANVALLGRNQERGASAKELLFSLNPIGSLKVIRGDVADSVTLSEVRGKIDKWSDGKIHHIAIFLGSGNTPPGHDFPLNHWREVFEINTFAPIGVAQAFYPLMLHKESSPSITLTAAISGIERVRAPMTYSVAKSALIAYTNHLAEALVQEGIRVNIISPGNVFYKGGRWEEILEERGDEISAFLEKSVGMKRLGTAKELAWVYFSLMSPFNSFMTGQNIISDGLQVKRVF